MTIAFFTRVLVRTSSLLLALYTTSRIRVLRVHTVFTKDEWSTRFSSTDVFLRNQFVQGFIAATLIIAYMSFVTRQAGLQLIWTRKVIAV